MTTCPYCKDEVPTTHNFKQCKVDKGLVKQVVKEPYDIDGKCPRCSTPIQEGCEHRLKKVGRGYASETEVIPHHVCEAIEFRVIDMGNPAWFNQHPYCKKHGAMLAMVPACDIWRCTTCGLGIEWRKYDGSSETE